MHMKLLRDTDFIAFDLETTGLHPLAAHIVEIGAVRFRGDGTILGEFQQLVDPGCHIPDNATYIHGITDDDVAGQPTIREALPRFLEFVGDSPAVMLAHNAAFDLGFLAAAIRRLRQPCPMHAVVDTLILARRRLQLPNHKLETIGRFLRLIHDARHRALEDTLLLKDVFLKLVGRRPVMRTVEQLFELCPTLSFEPFGGILDHPPAGFEELWLAIAQQQPVILVYEGGSSPGSPRVVTPLGSAQNRGRIYLVALCHETDSEKSYRLDRISSYRRIMMKT